MTQDTGLCILIFVSLFLKGVYHISSEQVANENINEHGLLNLIIKFSVPQGCVISSSGRAFSDGKPTWVADYYMYLRLTVS